MRRAHHAVAAEQNPDAHGTSPVARQIQRRRGVAELVLGLYPDQADMGWAECRRPRLQRLKSPEMDRQVSGRPAAMTGCTRCEQAGHSHTPNQQHSQQAPCRSPRQPAPLAGETHQIRQPAETHSPLPTTVRQSGATGHRAITASSSCPYFPWCEYICPASSTPPAECEAVRRNSTTNASPDLLRVRVQ